MASFLIPAAPASTGPIDHLGVEAGYLDTRYQAMQPEYETMLRGVGFRPGWRVLDAGCGGGSHLTLLSTLVGPAGKLYALDLAPENIAVVERHARAGLLHCPLEAHTGSVLSVPLPPNSVDGVWAANVSQYLTDADLRTMLAELKRVTRPGGVVAIKEIDATMFQILPIPHVMFWHLFEATAHAGVLQPSGALRTPQLPRWMREAGFAGITASTTLITRRAPLRRVEGESCTEVLRLLLHWAEQVELPVAELQRWRAFADPDSPLFILDHPDVCWCETQTVVTGLVP